MHNKLVWPYQGRQQNKNGLLVFGHLRGPDGLGQGVLQDLQSRGEVLVQDGHSAAAQILLLSSTTAQTTMKTELQLFSGTPIFLLSRLSIHTTTVTVTYSSI